MICLSSFGCVHKVFSPNIRQIKKGEVSPINGFLWTEYDMKEWGDIQIEKSKGVI